MKLVSNIPVDTNSSESQYKYNMHALYVPGMNCCRLYRAILGTCQEKRAQKTERVAQRKCE